jgi:hypothetical protein
MCTSRIGRNNVTSKWIRKTDAFVERAFGEAAKGASLVPYPCNKCANRKTKSKKAMVEHIWKNGFTLDYTRWIFHGEAKHMREEVLRHVSSIMMLMRGSGYVERLSRGTVHRRMYGRRARADHKGVLRHVRRGAEAPSLPDKGFSTGCHWAYNGVQVTVQHKSRRIRWLVDGY